MSNRSRRQAPRRPSARPTTTERRGPPWVLIGAAVIVVVAFGLAILVAGGETDAGAETADIRTEGALPPHQIDGVVVDPDTAVGMPAPTLSGTDFDGQPVTIENDGRPKMIVFMAHWCPHCQAELPTVTAWLNEGGKPDGVDIYAVNTNVNVAADNYPPSEWFEREDNLMPVVRDDLGSSAAAAYGLSFFPFWTIVDADGNVVLRTTGEQTFAGLNGFAAAALGTAQDE